MKTVFSLTAAAMMALSGGVSAASAYLPRRRLASVARIFRRIFV